MFNVDAFRYDEMRPRLLRRPPARARHVGRRAARRPQLPELHRASPARCSTRVPTATINLVMIKAYNDWHVDDWCGAYPDRFIPCGILPLFDVDDSVAEIRRLAAKGCHAVTFSREPRSARDAVDPLRRLGPPCSRRAATRAPCCAATSGRRRRASSTSPDAPAAVPMTLSSTMSIFTLVDLLWADFWHRFPDLRFSLTEGDVGWIPYFLWRAEHVHDRHAGWTKHDFGGYAGPRDIFDRAHPLLLHQRPDRGQARGRPQRRQPLLGVRLPPLRRHLARRAGSAQRHCSRRCPSKRSTRSPTRTRCATTGSIRSRRAPKTDAARGRVAGRVTRRRCRDPRRPARGRARPRIVAAFDQPALSPSTGNRRGERRSDQREPAVDGQDLTGHVARGGGEQERRNGRDLPRASLPAERNRRAVT